MKICQIDMIRLSPIGDIFTVLRITTTSGIVGWGELSDNRNDILATNIVKKAMVDLIGADALDMDCCMMGFKQAFGSTPSQQHCISTVWSSINQALWDIAAQVANQPLYKLLSKNSAEYVTLYANLNRSLKTDRSHTSFARQAHRAIESGFSFVKATPFDEVTPQSNNHEAVLPGIKRLEAIFDVVSASQVAVDCHNRFDLTLARVFLEQQRHNGQLYWVEDLFQESISPSLVADFRKEFPHYKWASGENVITTSMVKQLLEGADCPDVFMPDIKHLCGLDALRDNYLYAKEKGCSLSAHNPYGPISTAFTAHMAVAVAAEEPIEFGFEAVKDRESLCQEGESIENGRYYLLDKSGIGVAHSSLALEKYGTILVKGCL